MRRIRYPPASRPSWHDHSTSSVRIELVEPLELCFLDITPVYQFKQRHTISQCRQQRFRIVKHNTFFCQRHDANGFHDLHDPNTERER